MRIKKEKKQNSNLSKILKAMSSSKKYLSFLNNSSELIFGYATLLMIIFLFGFTLFFALKIRPTIPLGNDPISHLEYIEDLDKNFWKTGALSLYPLLFHSLLLLIHKVTSIPTYIIFSWLQFFALFFVISSYTFLAKNLFNSKIAFFSLLFLLGYSGPISVLIRNGMLPDVYFNMIILPLLFAIWIWAYKKTHQAFVFLIISVFILTLYFGHIASPFLTLFYLALFVMTHLKKVNFNLKPFRFPPVLIPLIFVGIETLIILTLVNSNHLILLFPTKESREQYLKFNRDIYTIKIAPSFVTNPYTPKSLSIDQVIGFNLFIFLFLSYIICAVMFAIPYLRKKIHPYTSSLLFLLLVSLFGILFSILPFPPTSPRILSEVYPLFILFVSSVFFFSFVTKGNPLKLLFIAFIIVLFLEKELSTFYPLYHTAFLFDDTKKRYAEILEIVRKHNLEEGTILVLPIKGYLQFLLPENQVIGPKRFPIAEEEKEMILKYFNPYNYQPEVIAKFKSLYPNLKLSVNFLFYQEETVASIIISELKNEKTFDPLCQKKPLFLHLRETVILLCEM